MYRVVCIEPPTSGLAAARPDPAGIDALVLVTTAGSVAADVERAVASLSEWRQVDALIVADSGR
jgi:hypothetical protein